MKKILLFALALSISVSALAADEPAQPSLQEFKLTLSGHLDDLSARMMDSLFIDSDQVLAVLAAARRSADYDTCVRPGWLTSKKTQVLACLDVSQKLASARLDTERSRARRALVTSTDQLFLNWLGSLPAGPRREFAVDKIRTPLADRWIAISRYVPRRIQDFNDGYLSACGYLELGPSVECAFNRVERFVDVDFPDYLRDQRRVIEQTARQLYREIEAFTD